ncbi:MAG: CoB--CoM heterodisulfide reductase iron-sulfur subunit B family protein [Desulfomicrobium sp.]|nr:CoB--CoM heterodisulfide reductase iron-sulfur subunit B family protein [Pseudomonadota bacterium]MBV1713401.1 CoB--CoM heterodisulfide reductase iron-sulfur subunit B family protein [Desulfomicrobium sp.]MBU4570465.1 CoB--CoM heterodisulfide reductase iron-sulfur subunit B family protein [Pseudomonadota bacterium]MBU4593822.1 CoB--CoM heterodisulfide reductase iron-sulfur subunit B family protein [Pseudomonadota bacterium]MBV1719724.1 CoB--CoM heterodisulfide reductase iron-sulfur subunit B
MKYAYFPGCKIAHHLPAHGKSVEAVCAHLGLELHKPEFSCCGYPVRQESRDASVYSALRSLALCARLGLELMTPCKCCFGNFRHALHQVGHDEKLKLRMKDLLADEGLDFPETTRVRHFLQVLDDNRSLVEDAVRRPQKGLKVACHYGCHALRPENITHFDDPFAPTIFERLVALTGASALPWDLSLECCGYPLRGRDETISGLLAARKMAGAKASGADVLATACTYCQLQFGGENHHPDQSIPAVLFSQILGLALGLEPKRLGIEPGEAWVRLAV